MVQVQFLLVQSYQAICYQLPFLFLPEPLLLIRQVDYFPQ